MNNIGSRRRAAIGASNNVLIIKGSDLSWEMGSISYAGANAASDYCIRSTQFLPLEKMKVDYVGQIIDNNDLPYWAYVVEYDANYTFVGRFLVLSTTDHQRKIFLNRRCAYVKFMFGRDTDTATPITVSEASGFVLSAAAIPTDYNPVMISSTGQSYRRFHTVTMTNQKVLTWLGSMGLMPGMEELVMTGQFGLHLDHNHTINSSTVTWSNYVPSLTKLALIPTKVGTYTDYFGAGHYLFTGLENVSDLQLGGLQSDGYIAFSGGGYFKSGNGTNTSTGVGLNLTGYLSQYKDKCGFANGSVPATTTITEYNWATGEVLTA